MDHPRKSCGIIFLNGCVGEYTTFKGDKINAPCKSLVCLPAGSEYSVLNAVDGLASPDAYLVEFNLLKNGEILTFGDSPFVIENVNSYIASELVLDAVKAYEAPIRSPLALKSAWYVWTYSFASTLSMISQPHPNRKTSQMILSPS